MRYFLRARVFFDGRFAARRISFFISSSVASGPTSSAANFRNQLRSIATRRGPPPAMCCAISNVSTSRGTDRRASRTGGRGLSESSCDIAASIPYRIRYPVSDVYSRLSVYRIRNPKNTGPMRSTPSRKWHREKGATPWPQLSDNPHPQNCKRASMNWSGDSRKSSAPDTPSTHHTQVSRSASGGATNSSQHLRSRGSSSTSRRTTARQARQSPAPTTAPRSLNAAHSNFPGWLNHAVDFGTATDRSMESCLSFLSSMARSCAIMAAAGRGPCGRASGARLPRKLSPPYLQNLPGTNRPGGQRMTIEV